MALESDKIESDNLFKDIVVTTEEVEDDEDLVYLPSDDSDVEEFLEFGSNHLNSRDEIPPTNLVKIEPKIVKKEEPNQHSDREDVDQADLLTQPYYDTEQEESMRDFLRIPEIRAILEDQDETQEDEADSAVLDINDSELFTITDSPDPADVIETKSNAKQTDLYTKTITIEDSQTSDGTIEYNLDEESTQTSNTMGNVEETAGIPVTEEDLMPLEDEVSIKSPPVAAEQPENLPEVETTITNIKSELLTEKLKESTEIVEQQATKPEKMETELEVEQDSQIKLEVSFEEEQIQSQYYPATLEAPAEVELNTSSHLTEHAYSQNENPDMIPDEEFYDNCISQVVGPGGNCAVIGEFAELMLNYFGEDFANSECSLFLKNLKKKITKMKQTKKGEESLEKEEPQPGTSRAAIMEDLIDAIILRPNIEVPMETSEADLGVNNQVAAQISETIDLCTADSEPLIEIYEPMEVEDNQEEIFEGPEPEVSSFLLRLDDFSKLMQQASQTIKNCEDTPEAAQSSMKESISSLKQQFKAMIMDFDGTATQEMETQTEKKKRTHEEKRKLNAKYKHLLAAQSTSEDSLDSDSEDYDQVLNLNRERQKSAEPDIPEISSTLPESPEVSFNVREATETAKVETTTKEKEESSSAHSSDLEGGDSEEDIDKLINFDGLEKVILDAEKGSGLGPKRKHKKKKKVKKSEDVIKESQDASSESSEVKNFVIVLINFNFILCYKFYNKSFHLFHSSYAKMNIIVKNSIRNIIFFYSIRNLIFLNSIKI